MSATPDSECSCSEARAHLEAFLDHECSADLTERLAQHVASCDHCSRLADAETHLRQILRSRCAEQAPPELRARVLGRLSMMRVTSQVSVTSSSVTSSADGTVTRTTTTTRSIRIERD
ncbi:mycothiol system anti-sigma-R factor [Actinomyces slackii]|uniref:Predicted transmembrane transcriptional regulator (Anti-sigma factor) n=1 Tax=Actinomyces slackii TaxID=52774 RepID=A0A448KFU0_9ACTO|nr:mycothiol system anti-sigma-R factor [Actinomyces slackii]VEG75762.1 Predicted transmembrane transcriptional regulator (anti-sigma factor) [Actinomyces slackii]